MNEKGNEKNFLKLCVIILLPFLIFFGFPILKNDDFFPVE